MKCDIRCIRCLRVLRGEVDGDIFNCWLAGCGAMNSLKHDNQPSVKIGLPRMKKGPKCAKPGKKK